MIHIANSSKSIVPLRSESKTLKMRSTNGWGRITPNLISVKRNSLGVTCAVSPILFLRICVINSIVVATFSWILRRINAKYESKSVLMCEPTTSLVRVIHTVGTFLMFVFFGEGNAATSNSILTSGSDNMAISFQDRRVKKSDCVLVYPNDNAI